MNTTTYSTESSSPIKTMTRYSGYDDNGRKFKPYRNKPSIRQALLEILSFLIILTSASAWLGGTISIFICYFGCALGLIGLFAWTRRHALLFLILALCVIGLCVVNIALRSEFNGDDKGQCLPFFYYGYLFPVGGGRGNTTRDLSGIIGLAVVGTNGNGGNNSTDSGIGGGNGGNNSTGTGIGGGNGGNSGNGNNSTDSGIGGGNGGNGGNNATGNPSNPSTNNFTAVRDHNEDHDDDDDDGVFGDRDGDRAENTFNNSIWCGSKYIVYITNGILILFSTIAAFIAATLLFKRRPKNAGVGNRVTQTTTTETKTRAYATA